MSASRLEEDNVPVQGFNAPESGVASEPQSTSAAALDAPQLHSESIPLNIATENDTVVSPPQSISSPDNVLPPMGDEHVSVIVKDTNPTPPSYAPHVTSPAEKQDTRPPSSSAVSADTRSSEQADPCCGGLLRVLCKLFRTDEEKLLQRTATPWLLISSSLLAVTAVPALTIYIFIAMTGAALDYMIPTLFLTVLVILVPFVQMRLSLEELKHSKWSLVRVPLLAIIYFIVMTIFVGPPHVPYKDAFKYFIALFFWLFCVILQEQMLTPASEAAALQPMRCTLKSAVFASLKILDILTNIALINYTVDRIKHNACSMDCGGLKIAMIIMIAMGGVSIISGALLGVWHKTKSRATDIVLNCALTFAAILHMLVTLGLLAEAANTPPERFIGLSLAYNLLGFGPGLQDLKLAFERKKVHPAPKAGV